MSGHQPIDYERDRVMALESEVYRLRELLLRNNIDPETDQRSPIERESSLMRGTGVLNKQYLPDNGLTRRSG